jgi:broad specificity phosphatase PhoE
LRAELAVSREHLRSVLEGYWDRDWRRRHKGYGESPEDHLWRAATAVEEMRDADGNLNP